MLIRFLVRSSRVGGFEVTGTGRRNLERCTSNLKLGTGTVHTNMEPGNAEPGKQRFVQPSPRSGIQEKRPPFLDPRLFVDAKYPIPIGH